MTLFFFVLEMLFTDIDATGKPRSGMLRVNLAMFGSYTGCLALSDAHYCLSIFDINFASLININVCILIIHLYIVI